MMMTDAGAGCRWCGGMCTAAQRHPGDGVTVDGRASGLAMSAVTNVDGGNGGRWWGAVVGGWCTVSTMVVGRWMVMTVERRCRVTMVWVYADGDGYDDDDDQ